MRIEWFIRTRNREVCKNFELSNSAGMRREKNPQGFFDLLKPVWLRHGGAIYFSAFFFIMFLIRRGKSNHRVSEDGLEKNPWVVIG
jgi:hypothetical protein